MGREVCVLGVDPGFASFGMAVVRLFPERERVLSVQVVRTKKSPKKRNVKVADDNFCRARAIASMVRETVKRWKPLAIAGETMSFPRNASAAAKVAMTWGILADLTEDLQLPMATATPQEIKKVVCDIKTATKEDVRRALEARYPRQFDAFKAEFPAKKPPQPNGQWEHGFDAVGAVVACLDTDVIRMARGMAG
jgi:Holliday junction resolvasome RuvABC endonuclease subunit